MLDGVRGKARGGLGVIALLTRGVVGKPILEVLRPRPVALVLGRQGPDTPLRHAHGVRQAGKLHEGHAVVKGTLLLVGELARRRGVGVRGLEILEPGTWVEGDEAGLAFVERLQVAHVRTVERHGTRKDLGVGRRERVGHHRAHREARHVDATAVDGYYLAHVLDKREDEVHVARETRVIPAVPAHLDGGVREDAGEAVTVGKVGPAALLGAVQAHAVDAVQVDDERHGLRGGTQTLGDILEPRTRKAIGEAE